MSPMPPDDLSNLIPNAPDASLLPTTTPNSPAQLASQSVQTPVQPPSQNGKLKALLSDFFTGAGSAAMHHVGLETPEEKQAREFRQNMQQQQFESLDKQRQSLEAIKQQLANQQIIQNTPFELPPEISGALGLPAGTKLTQKDFGAAIGKYVTGQSRENAADTAADARIKAAQIAAAGKADKPNEIQLIMRANQGDPEAKAALQTLQGNRMALAGARGASLGQFRVQSVYDPETGQTTPMFMRDIQQAQAQGKTLLSAGALPAGVLLASQRLKSEATPAIQQVNQYLDVYDDPQTRAVFARVMKDNPMPEGGDIHSWMGNILDQSLKAGLSPRAQLLIPRLKRLNETVGTLRATLGLPATNSATALTLSLLPGASTPSSAYAKDQMSQLGQVVDQALAVPGLGNAPSQPQRQSGNVAPEGTRIKVGDQMQVKRGGKWVPE